MRRRGAGRYVGESETASTTTRRASPTLLLDLLIWGVWTLVVVLAMSKLWIATGATFCLWVALGCLRMQKVEAAQKQTLQGLEELNQRILGLSQQVRARREREERRGKPPH